MNKIFFFLLLLLTVLQIHNLINFPDSRGFDAPNHADYIEFLKTERRIPLAEDGWEMYQPPLYYLFASLFPNTTAAKIIGLTSWIILTYTAFYFFRQIFQKTDLALIGTLIVVSLPVVLYLMPVIGNEFFSGVMISITLVYYLLNRQTKVTKTKIFLGILLGLALLTKATAFVLVISVVLNELWLQRKNFKQLGEALVVPIFITVFLAGLFYGRNILIYKNPFISPVDLPEFQEQRKPSGRNLKFFLDLSGFYKMDLYKSQHDSFIPGTYFSWFYDGHNVLLPVQAYSKKGILLVLLSFPLFILAVLGYFKTIRKVTAANLFLVIYPVLLITAYAFYNLKIPLYSTVKGSFLISLVIPFAYFLLISLKNYKINTKLVTAYLIIYIMIIISNFWINPIWYTPLLSN